MKWDTKIKRVSNGYLLEIPNERGKLEQVIFEDGERDIDDFRPGGEQIDSFAGLLWFIQEQIGPCSGRYDKRRLYIVIKPGDKHEDFTEEHSKEIWGGDVTKRGKT